MAKVMTAKVKLQCPGGQATPAPPVGPALGQHGVNIGQFVMQFNERTKEMKGTTIPVEITIYSDRTFEFITKSPPAAVLWSVGFRDRPPFTLPTLQPGEALAISFTLKSKTAP